ncbi:unnamed protein product [Rotaria sordida]|uniref:Tetratricopeptide repeat protein n=2 Tax=Rotaria sordida TaxID=392033 RepID=A0A815T135_9BILA|nr:unnamed protein product [Rotaria sordida]CAF1495942.1 unnamed protein product [Rotaria sordida]CAF4046662.1 unnamed protein product [Rotaria sordida]CAF4096551.1 unnamed protein product [Rotaria sordida]
MTTQIKPIFKLSRFQKYIKNNENINEKIVLIITDRQLLEKFHDEMKIIAIYVYSDTKTEEESEAQAFYWYSTEIFLYSILNEALRNQDIDALFAMYYFIFDLTHQLVEQHRKFLHESNKKKLTLYRGQKMFMNEFELLCNSQDQFISFNSFLSTSDDKEVALVFADIPSTTTSKPILFEIIIDTNMKTVPFAKIKDQSNFHDEADTIINVGAIFRIDEVKCNENEEISTVRLLLCSEDDYELNSILQYEEDKIQLADFDALGWVFYKQGLHDREKLFFENLLEELIKLKGSLHDITNCYRGLGFVLHEKEEYDEALKNHKEELKIRLQMDPTSTHINIATNYMAIANVYQWKKKYKMAFKYIVQAYKIVPSNREELSQLYTIVADVYQGNNQFELAGKYYQKALNSALVHYPENYFEIAVIYRNVGALYSKLGGNTEALDCYSKAREILLKSSLKNHKIFVELEEAMEARAKAIDDK